MNDPDFTHSVGVLPFIRVFPQELILIFAFRDHLNIA